MKKRLCLLMLLVYISAFGLTFTSFAAGQPPVVLDFFTEDQFDLYFNTGSANECDVVWESNAIHITSTGDLDLGDRGDPNFTLAIDSLFNCDDYPFMKIKIKNLSVAPVFEMHFSTSVSGGIVAACCTHIDISAKDTEFKQYVFNVPERNLASMEVNDLGNDETMWAGDLLILRLDGMWIEEPSGQVPEGSEMYIEYVAFFQTKEEADKFDVELYRASITPKPTAAPTPVPTPTVEKTATPVSTVTPKTTSATDSPKGGKVLPLVFGGIGIVAVVAVVAIVIINKKKK